MHRINLHTSAEFGAIVARHTQVHRILCGHHHRPIVASVGQAIATISPSVAHAVELDLRTEAPPAFLMEPPAYQLHRYTPQSGIVTHTAYVESGSGALAIPPRPRLSRHATLTEALQPKQPFLTHRVWSKLDGSEGDGLMVDERRQQAFSLERDEVAIVFKEDGDDVVTRLALGEELEEGEALQVPFSVQLAVALLTRLQQDPDFHQDVLDWYDVHTADLDEED